MVKPQETDRCPKCGAPAHELERHCHSCGTDLGAPNVRACNAADEIQALRARAETARDGAKKRSCLSEFDAFVKWIQENSRVVIAVPAQVALNLFSDERALYANYEQLVGGAARQPATFAHDSHRRAVAGSLFASYGDRIRYGFLSVHDTGLATYGEIFLRLKPVAIDDRVSFLEMNSFRFAEKHKPTASDPFPPGYRASWENRHLLAAAKIGPIIHPGQTEEDWQQLLVVSDGKHRDKDDFIEAHLYDGFNCFSVASLKEAGKIQSGHRTIVRAAMKAFDKFIRRQQV